MGRYVLRRLLQLVPVLIGTTFLIYLLVWAIPGDPVAAKCGDRACPDSYINTMREKYNLDDSLLVQYGKYLANLAQGDFGETFSGIEVSELIANAYPCLLYTSPSPRDRTRSRMPSSA